MNARAALLLAAIVAACGGEPAAPRISMLRLTPEGGVRPGEKLTATIDVVDEDDDVDGGAGEIGLLRRGGNAGEIFHAPIAPGRSLARSTLGFDITLPAGAIPGRYDLSVVVLDSATRRSNALVTEFEVLP